MKKLAILLVVSSFLFSACFLNNFDQKPDEENHEGILREQSADDDYKGTHLLDLGDMGAIALRSLSINLSAEEYLGNKVEVTGIYNDDDEVFEVTGIMVLEYLHDVNALAQLTTYKNTELGFELMYYDDWKIEEFTNYVVFYAPLPNLEEKETLETEAPAKMVQDTVKIEQKAFAYTPVLGEDGSETGSPLKAYFAQNFPEMGDISSMMRKIGPSALDAVLIEKSALNVSYYFYRNGLIYVMTFEGHDPVESKTTLQEFDRMVSDFEFIVFSADDSGEISEDITDTVEPVLDIKLATFESNPYKFSSKYPASWYYAGKTSSEDGVIVRYAFDKEPLKDEDLGPSNGTIFMDIISTGIPSSGVAWKKGDLSGVKVSSASGVTIYFSMDNKTFKVYGPKEYENVISAMAAATSTLQADSGTL